MGRTQAPFRAEWEKAARGTDARIYSWGDKIDCNNANYNMDCVGDTSSVKSYPKGTSPYGAYDMAGNVSEWVSDFALVYNPSGWTMNDYHVTKGGSWFWGNGDEARSSNHSSEYETIPDFQLGFRCAYSP